MHKILYLALAFAALFIPLAASARTSYASPELACVSAYEVVSLGNMGRFVAVTNVPGPLMWSVGDVGLVDAGPVLVAPMTEIGLQEVSVIWGSQSARCYVQVVPEPGYGEVPAYPFYTDSALNVSLSSVLYPFLPNTGFSPQNGAALAFAAVLLLGIGAALYPHVRKAFIAVIR